VDLDEELKKFRVIATAPNLYEDFVASGMIPKLLSLLSHENADIANDVVELVRELTDQDHTTEDEDLDPLIDTMVFILIYFFLKKIPFLLFLI